MDVAARNVGTWSEPNRASNVRSHARLRLKFDVFSCERLRSLGLRAIVELSRGV